MNRIKSAIGFVFFFGWMGMLQGQVLPPCDLDLVGLYGFDFTAIDLSGNANDGVLAGNAVIDGDLFIPRDDVSFVGLPEELLQGVTDFTISFRIRFDSFHYTGFAPYNYILSVYNNNNAFGFGYVRTENAFRVHLQDEYDVPLPDLLDSTRWYCMAVQRDGNQLRYFLDGEQVGSDLTVPSAPIEVAPDGLVIGQDKDCDFGCYAANQSMMGNLDNLRFYHRVLAAEELEQFCEKTIETIVYCEGQDPGPYPADGLYEENFLTADGCDSIRAVEVTLQENVYGEVDTVICGGAAVEGYTTTGVYLDSFPILNGCDSIRTLNLTVLNGGTTFIDTTICVEDAYYLYNKTGIYTDSFLSTYGCDSIRILDLKVIPADPLYIPNAFSPNFDGINDYFRIEAAPDLEVQILNLQIFSRWGELVYENQDAAVRQNLWDGRWRGQALNPGVYLYVLEYECLGRRRQETGTIQLLF